MAKEQDPVCGMDVDAGTSLKSEYQGHTYYFCCQGCKKTFDQNPSAYAG